MGGSDTAAWLNPLMGSGLTAAERIAREAIQNSTDAALDPTGPFVRISSRMADPEEFPDLVDGLHLDHGPFERLKALALPKGNSFTRLSGQGADGVSLLYLEDWDTVGLGGKLTGPVSSSDHFRRLCLWLGKESTDPSMAEKGGSFGYGKSVYAGASDVRTVIYYSSFEPTAETDGRSARLFGCSFFPAHVFEKTAYTGRAWFGLPQSDNTVCFPIFDDAAHAIAQFLGFDERGPGDTGTSILIVGAETPIGEIRSAIEKFWWPAILDHQLAVELRQEDKEIDPPRPLTRGDLKPFLHCYELITGRAKVSDPKTEKVANLSKMEGVGLGRWAGVGVEPDSEDQVDDEDITDIGSQFAPLNTVALIRNLKMVVEYADFGVGDIQSACGVFQADPEVHSVLRQSEPPPHNRWDYLSERLNANESQTVKRILNRTRVQFQQFQRSLMPAIEEPTGKFRALERTLARWLAGKDITAPPPPPTVPDPFQIQMNQERRQDNGGVSIASNAQIGLRDDFEAESLPVSVAVSVRLLANDNHTLDEFVPIASLKVDDKSIPTSNGGSENAEFTLKKGSTVSIVMESEPFDPEWHANVSLSVRVTESIS